MPSISETAKKRLEEARQREIERKKGKKPEPKPKPILTQDERAVRDRKDQEKKLAKEY